MRKVKVAFHAKSIYDVSTSFFKSLGIKAIVTDLDNTLDTYDVSTPGKEAFELKDRLQKAGIALIVVSNNTENRVRPYCEKLGVDYLHDARKYFKARIARFLKKEGYEVKDCLFVGDQLFTDRIYVSKLKGRLLLTEPLSSKDQFFTRFVRRYDIRIRKKWLRQGRLGQSAE